MAHINFIDTSVKDLKEKQYSILVILSYIIILDNKQNKYIIKTLNH